MLSEKTRKKASPESCDSCPRWREVKEERVRLAQLISNAREGFEARLMNGRFWVSPEDYLKLIQMEKEIDGGGAREIKVTWVDPVPTSKPEK